MTPPSIYLHFPDKETLLFAVCARQFDRFDEVMAAAAVPTTDPVDELRRRGEAYVRFGLEHPEAYRIMFMGQSTLSTRQRGTIEKTGSTAFTHHAEAVQRADRLGRPARRPRRRAHRDLSSGPVCTVITSLLISLADFPWPDRDEMIHDHCELQLRALMKGVA